MRIGLVGAGRMGGNIARRLLRAGHGVVVYDRDPAAGAAVCRDGAEPAAGLHDFVPRLAAPRTVWLMLPAGAPTEAALATLSLHLQAGDTLIDGGNSDYRDDIRRAAQLGARGIDYLDVGTSGGVWGLERGYCLMIGGARAVAQRHAPLFEALAPGSGGIAPTAGGHGDAPAERGYLWCGPSGAGHFVKMVHNGIEYGLMQAYAEGFAILERRAGEDLPPEARYAFDLADIAELWRRGSVISSWLLDLAAAALARDARLAGYAGSVADSGEGRWALEAAVEEAVPAHVLAAALFARFRSRRHPGFADKLLSALREQFGGHVEGGAEEDGA